MQTFEPALGPRRDEGVLSCDRAKTSTPGSQLDILIVDDQRNNLLALEAILGKLGHNLVLASSGEEALRQVLRRDIALVLLDVRMPGVSGFETARLIRERERSRSIPIIFLTGAMSNEDMMFEGYSSGAVDYLVKPFVPEILLAKVKVFLDLAAARKNLEEEVIRRRRAESELKTYADRLRLALDGASLGTWHWDLQSKDLAWSERCRKLFGVSPTEPITRELFVERLHPEDRARVVETVTEAIERKKDIKLEYRIVLLDGTLRWISSRARPYYDADGSPLCIEGVVYDVTEHAEAAEEIRTLNAALTARASELEGLNQELEAFVYSASHDLRSPVRHLHGFVDLLRESLGDNLQGENRLFLKKIASSASRMSQLLDDLLAFSRLGREDVQSAVVDLNALLDETIEHLEEDLAEREVVWKRSPLPDVVGDPAMLRQVFMNIVGNAIKYTRDSDPATIEVGWKKVKSEAVVHIRDNGAGFEMAYASRLFQVFQRLHGDDEYEGTGIGLANVRRIVERHGGRTWAEGKVGKGATFFFSLKPAEIG